MKAYLNRAYKIEHRINVKLERLERLRALAEKTTATLSDMLKSPNRDGGNEDILARIVDMENEIKRDINHLLDIKEDVQGAIETVEEPELKLLLELRYLCYRSWGDIAEEMNYDVRQIHRIHSKALFELNKKRCH